MDSACTTHWPPCWGCQLVSVVRVFFCNVASCQWGTGLRSRNHFSCQPRSKAVLFSICRSSGEVQLHFESLCTRMDTLFFNVDQQKCALFCLQTSLLKIVLLSNCTCTLQRGKGRDPEQVCSWRNSVTFLAPQKISSIKSKRWCSSWWFISPNWSLGINEADNLTLMLLIYFNSLVCSYTCGRLCCLLSINLQQDNNLLRTGNFPHEEMTLCMVTKDNKSPGNRISRVVLTHSSYWYAACCSPRVFERISPLHVTEDIWLQAFGKDIVTMRVCLFVLSEVTTGEVWNGTVWTIELL